MLRRFIDAKVIAALSEEGQKIANAAKGNASWSTTIPNAISAGQATSTPSGYEILIKVDLKKAPQAAAFEFGSGIHATKETPKKYIIAPKNKSSLAIPLERWPNFQFPAIPGQKMIGQSEDTGRLLLRYVEHPGVAPRPFITPAVADHRFSLKSKILKAIGSGLRSISTRVEIIK